MYKVACTRFNNTTWGEKADWRRRHNHPGCIYGSPTDITETTTTATSTVFVIEMNNDANRVMGVGKLVISAGAGVSSTSTTNSKLNGRVRADGRVFNVYNSRNYNRYKFVGSEKRKSKPIPTRRWPGCSRGSTACCFEARATASADKEFSPFPNGSAQRRSGGATTCCGASSKSCSIEKLITSNK